MADPYIKIGCPIHTGDKHRVKMSAKNINVLNPYLIVFNSRNEKKEMATREIRKYSGFSTGQKKVS